MSDRGRGQAEPRPDDVADQRRRLDPLLRPRQRGEHRLAGRGRLVLGQDARDDALAVDLVPDADEEAASARLSTA